MTEKEACVKVTLSTIYAEQLAQGKRLDRALQAQEEDREELDDHEDRIRKQEDRKYVTPKGLWGVVATGIAIATGLISLILALTSEFSIRS